MWQHNVYYECMTFSVVRYESNIPHHTEHHAHIINVMLPHHQVRMTFSVVRYVGLSPTYFTTLNITHT